MEFKVSKMKFIKNELLKSFLVLLIISMILYYSVNRAENWMYTYFQSNMTIIFFIMIWIFIYKNIKYYKDVLYIDGNNIELKREKRYSYRYHVTKIQQENYKIIELNYFKEHLNEFILYGKVEVTKITRKREFNDEWSERKETQIVEKLIIRKNFEKEQDIRKLLKKQLNLINNR